MIQHLWAIGVDWDEQIPESVASPFAMWISELEQIPKFSIPRKYWPSDLVPVHTSLHIFGDASEKAYAACCYLRVESKSGEVYVTFVMSRMRVAPFGKISLSLPRLELQASVLCIRLYTLVEEELHIKIDDVVFWTDSNTVVQYLNNESRRFKTFVGNRIAVIRSASSPGQWRHCPGHLNPSDLGTRGMTMTELTNDNVWLQGPDFLWKTPEFWPMNIKTNEIERSDPEVRSPLIAQVEMTASVCGPVDPRDFSTLSKLLIRTAWCL